MPFRMSAKRGIFGAFLKPHCLSMRQTLLRIAPDTFTMLLVATVVLASFAPPTAAFETPVKIATDVAIAFMFFLYGARLATANVIAGVAHWRLHALVLASTFVMFPAVGLLLFHCLPQWLVPGPLALGMLYLCLLPSTIQSSLAFTSIAGGNVPAAMCSATLSSLIGAVATPLLVAMFASARGAAPTGDAIGEIGLLLVAPLLAGQCLRPWIGDFVARHKAILGGTHRGSGSGHHARQHLPRREGLRVQQGGHDRHRLLRIEEEPRGRRADGGRALPRPRPRHDPSADHALPSDAAHGLRRPRPALGAGSEGGSGIRSDACSRAAAWSHGVRALRAFAKL